MLLFGGSVVDIDELVPGDAGELALVDGLVVGGDDGVVVDGDAFGEGVTTGGVFGDVDVLVSRWQPARPSASPAQSNVASAALLMIVSIRLRTQSRFSRFDAMASDIACGENRLKNSGVVIRQRRATPAFA